MMEFRSYRWLVFGILALGYVTVIFHRLCPAVVALDLIADFAATGALIGVMASAYFYPYALMQIPSGLLADSFGPRKTVTISLLFAGAGSVAFGLAPTLGWAVAARVLVGLGASMLFVSTLKIVSQWFTKSEFAMMSGLMNAAGGLGALTAAAPLALLTGWVGWRVDFVLIGAATLIVVAAIWWIVRDNPQSMGWPAVEPELATASRRESWTLTEKVAEGGVFGRALATSDPRQSVFPRVPGASNGLAKSVSAPFRRASSWSALFSNLGRVIRNGRLWWAAGWFFLQGGVFFGVGGLWGGPYLMNTYGLTRQQTGNVLNMISIGMIVGSVMAPWLSNSVFFSRKKVLVLFTAIFALDVAAFALMPDSLPLPALYAAFLIFAICGSGTVPVAFAASKELFPLEMAGVVLGFINMFPLGGGSVFQPLIGFVMDHWARDSAGAYPVDAFRAMWTLCLCATGGMFVCALMMKETISRSVPSSAPESDRTSRRA